MPDEDVNRFEALCDLAARERWCWRLICTTCGHSAFRWALKAISRGFHPNSEHWPVHFGPNATTTTLEQRNGPLPPGGGWPLAEQIAIQGCMAGCRLDRIASHVPFPDWLGYLGITPSYTETAEAENHSISDSVGRQLAAIVRPGGPAEVMLNAVIAGRPLRWSDLELVEADYSRNAARWP